MGFKSQTSTSNSEMFFPPNLPFASAKGGKSGVRNLLIVLFGLALLPACHPSYSRRAVGNKIKELAKIDYDLQVSVVDVGQTINVRYEVPNVVGELASEDQKLAKNIDNLMVVLSRVVLSADDPPDFFVVDVADADNPGLHFVLTRYVDDLRKMMAEGLSRSSFTDRLLMEFVINGKRVPYDPYEMDLVRLMLMGAEASYSGPQEEKEFETDEVSYPDFLAKVSANTMRRLFRENEKKVGGYVLRKVEAQFGSGKFEIFLDLVSKPRAKAPANWIDVKILPWVAKEAGNIFNSYRFKGFDSILVVEKNSGKLLSVPRR